MDRLGKGWTMGKGTWLGVAAGLLLGGASVAAGPGVERLALERLPLPAGVRVVAVYG